MPIVCLVLIRLFSKSGDFDDPMVLLDPPPHNLGVSTSIHINQFFTYGRFWPDKLRRWEWSWLGASLRRVRYNPRRA